MQIKYQDYLKKNSLSKEELLAFSWASLIEDIPAEGCGILPAPPFLMFDRVIEIKRNGKTGSIIAEQDIHLDDWFFQCHFRKDPVQPGCLGVDAVWQLVGLYASLCGAKGAARALGCNEVSFFGQIRPHDKIVTYNIDIKRLLLGKAPHPSFVIGSATVSVDGAPIYTINDAKVGYFIGIQYDNYPHLAKNAKGGKMG